MKIPRRFEPTDEELIDRFLRNKILNNPIPEFNLISIPYVTMYGEKLNPWEKFPSEGNVYPWQAAMDDMGKDAEYDRLFVFSQVTSVGKKSGNNFQKNRIAGDGTWRGNHKHAVKYNGNIIGYSRLMTFGLPNGKETLGHWTMNEYSIKPAAYPGLPASDLVICKIKKHHGKSSIDGKVIRSEKKDVESKKRRQITSKEDRGIVNHAVPAFVNLDNHDLPETVEWSEDELQGMMTFDSEDELVY